MYNKEERMEMELLERKLNEYKGMVDVQGKRIKQYQEENAMLRNQIELWKCNYSQAMSELVRRKGVDE